MCSKNKICKDCLIELPIEMFRFTNNNYRNDCRKCENLKRVERRKLKKENNPDYKQKLREDDKLRKRQSRQSN
jgi:hypothetical protein